jgi:hypothetical protein
MRELLRTPVYEPVCCPCCVPQNFSVVSLRAVDLTEVSISNYISYRFKASKRAIREAKYAPTLREEAAS